MLPSFTTPAAHAPVACPRCGAPMRILERDGVIVDQCRGCGGVFLDHGELERLAAIERWDADDDDDDDDDDHDDRRRSRRSGRSGEWRELSPSAAGPAGWGPTAPAPQPWAEPWAGVGPGLSGHPAMPPAPMAPPYPGAPVPPPMPPDPRGAAGGSPRPPKKAGFLRDLLEGFGD